MKISEFKDRLDHDGYEVLRDFEPSILKDEVLREKVQTLKALLWELDDYVWENENVDEDDYSVELPEEEA